MHRRKNTQFDALPKLPLSNQSREGQPNVLQSVNKYSTNRMPYLTTSESGKSTSVTPQSHVRTLSSCSSSTSPSLSPMVPQRKLPRQVKFTTNNWVSQLSLSISVDCALVAQPRSGLCHREEDSTSLRLFEIPNHKFQQMPLPIKVSSRAPQPPSGQRSMQKNFRRFAANHKLSLSQKCATDFSSDACKELPNANASHPLASFAYQNQPNPRIVKIRREAEQQPDASVNLRDLSKMQIKLKSLRRSKDSG